MARVLHVHPDSATPAASPATRDEILRAVDALVDECRIECLWYLRRDFYPHDDRERLQVLDSIQERSSRDVFQRAGALKAWLSRHSSDGSASS